MKAFGKLKPVMEEDKASKMKNLNDVSSRWMKSAHDESSLSKRLTQDAKNTEFPRLHTVIITVSSHQPHSKFSSSFKKSMRR